MKFEVLILEAERSGYMLGSHSAREGETVRGMPRKSTLADIGFYERDPEEDVKLPSTPTPAGVKATYNVISDAFKTLIQNPETKNQFISAVEPFVSEWNTVKTQIGVLDKLIQRRASLEKTLRTAGPQSVNRIRSMLGEVKDMIDLVSKKVSNAYTFMTENEANIVNTCIQLLTSNAENAKAIEDALNRYFSVVKYRKEQAENMGGQNYMTITPVISLVKFFNNTLSAASKSSEASKAITTHKSSKSVLKQLGDNPKAAPVIRLTNLVKLVAPKLRDEPEYKGSIPYVAAKQEAHQIALQLKEYLPELIFQSLLVHLNRFFSMEEGAEGKLMNLLLTTIPRSLL